MKLFVTVAEATADAAIELVRGLTADHDGVEIRVERFAGYDPAALRNATAKLIIVTRRGDRMQRDEVAAALDAGIDLVDVEYGGDLRWLGDFRERVVLSHHDYDGMPDVEMLLRDMRSHRCVHTKLAVTPRSLEDNFCLLDESGPGTTLIGMGEHGLFSRVLAPFVGSELTFVSPTAAASAAPGQLSLERALEIYGTDRANLRAEHVFAIAGNPAGHSLSPAIHNPLFRSKGVPAAYTIASVESFDEVADAFLAGRLSGLSITAPFKEDAYRFARERGAVIGENAVACGAVNTLVQTKHGVIADSTDVDGFTQLLARLCGRDRKTVALIGAGGTARAALVAIERAGMQVIVYNRTPSKAAALARMAGAASEPLDALSRFDGEIVINTLPPGAEVMLPLRPGMTYIEAAYGHGSRERAEGVEWIDGLELLRAQAVRQHELFMKVFDGS